MKVYANRHAVEGGECQSAGCGSSRAGANKTQFSICAFCWSQNRKTEYMWNSLQTHQVLLRAQPGNDASSLSDLGPRQGGGTIHIYIYMLIDGTTLQAHIHIYIYVCIYIYIFVLLVYIYIYIIILHYIYIYTF